MNIAIIGGGAIGLLFASYLHKEHKVTLLCRRKNQVDLLQTDGLTIETETKTVYNDIYVTSNWEEIRSAELVILAVKQYDLQNVLSMLVKHSDGNTSTLFLQNGMSHLQLFDQIGMKNISIGSVEHGVTKINDCHIQINGIGQTNLACYCGNDEKIKVLLSMEDFPFIYMDDYEFILQKKLIVNAIINPLTTFYQVKNGELLNNPHYHASMKMLFNEIIACFPKLSKVHFSEIERICEKTKSNYSSMYQDIIESKQTEVDAILGYVIQVSDRKQIPLTTFLYHSIKGIEYNNPIVSIND